NECHPVPGTQLERLHWAKRLAHQLGSLIEQLGDLAAAALVQVARHDVNRIIDGYDPFRVVERTADDLELRTERRLQPLDILPGGCNPGSNLGCRVFDRIRP